MRYRQAMDNAFDVLTFLAYAATLGLFIGTLLGGLALLLATPAHASEPGSLLLRRGPDAAATPARLVSTETVVRTDGPIQRVRVVQAFRNPLDQTQEGVYALRLPENAMLERLVVRLQGSEHDVDDDSEGDELAPAAPGPAVLSTDETSVVARSITGIEPGEVILVELEYHLIGRYDRGRSAMRLLTRSPSLPAAAGRRRRSAARSDAVPLGVEGAWVDRAKDSGAPWLWLVPVVALYVAVAFFS